jgi:hypothetical protein
MRLYPSIFRQGDVCLVQVAGLPAGCELVPDQEQKIVLAWGEATGHHHRIEDHVLAEAMHPSDVGETVAPGAQAKARLWRDKKGERFLEVDSPVTLRHEEHTAHTVPPGVYKLPNQVEYTPAALAAPAALRRVAD